VVQTYHAGLDTARLHGAACQRDHSRGRTSRRPFVWALAALTSLLVVVPAAAADPTTLNIDLQSDTDFIDPALDYYQLGWQLEYATCATLVNLADRDGQAGAVIQPDVALTLPQISDGGRTFQLRDDFAFDTGEKVTRATFKHVFDRLRDPAMQSPGAHFFSDVIGIDARGQTLVFHLSDAHGDFLARLTLPFTCAVPLDAPIDPAGSTILASAGPYHIVSRIPRQQIVLERNPNYHAGRPARFDRIVYTVGVAPDQALQHVETGVSDWGADETYLDYQSLWDAFGPNSPAAALGFQQLFVNPLLATSYIGLNTSRPLFADPTVRKAVNLALDRPALIAAAGAFSGTPTDQILPPGMAGFRDADLYPLDGPRVAAARALMAGRTATAVLYTSTRPSATVQAQIIQTDLAAIGSPSRCTSSRGPSRSSARGRSASRST
jgi:peptide/nickel transport system substrate-binding protein